MNRRIKVQREKEFVQNINDNALGEPHILRDLDLLEQHVLKEKHIGAYRFVKLNHYLIPLNALAIGITAYFGVFKNYLNADLFVDIVIYLSFALFAQIGLIFKENSMYKDLRSPVFRVTGSLLKFLTTKRKRKIKKFVIRGVPFDSEENRDIENFWDKWNEGDKVYIEYSPFTKHIWKIEKV
ncbi:MAG: hypothetical protein Q8P25_05070 [Candidatus Curtissbacteria bacterium]|nr:hypothetical protein [Candidatus Curtissbacteria bacterium]